MLPIRLTDLDRPPRFLFLGAPSDDIEIGRGATIRPQSGPPAKPAGPSYVPAAEFERRRRENVLAALRQADFKLTGKQGAATLLGLAPSTLRSQMRALGIHRADRPQS